MCVCVSLTIVFQHELREEVIEKVKWNINRESPEDKLRDLLQWMKAVKRDTIHSVRYVLVTRFSHCDAKLESSYSSLVPTG